MRKYFTAVLLFILLSNISYAATLNFEGSAFTLKPKGRTPVEVKQIVFDQLEDGTNVVIYIDKNNEEGFVEALKIENIKEILELFEEESNNATMVKKVSEDGTTLSQKRDEEEGNRFWKDTPEEVKKGQAWVMRNFRSGQKWNRSFWESKFGRMEEVEYKGNLNPRIIKMYYLESIDMSFLVNIYKGNMITWRRGLAHE